MNEPLASIEETLAHEAPLFAKAIQAVVTANPEQLRRLLIEDPNLVDQRSCAPHQATLLHYVASNAIEDALQQSPDSIYNELQHCASGERPKAVDRAIAVAELLIASGAEIDAIASAYGGGKLQTPLNWLVSSGHPQAAGIMPQMTEVFCRAGARLDGLADDSSPVFTALAFGHPQAADVLFRYGALCDNLILAAAAGELEQVKAHRTQLGWEIGELERCRTEWLKLPTDPGKLAELALVFASMCGREEVIRFMIDEGVDKNCMPPGTHMTSAPLHTASLVCQEKSVDLLIALQCDPTLVEPRYQGNAVSWAREGNCPRIIQKVGTYLPRYLRATEGSTPELQEFIQTVYAGDAEQLKTVLSKYAFTRAQLDGPWFHFDAPAVVQLKSRPEMLECLLDAGANINQKSLWWAGGFGVLDDTDEQLAEQLLRYGAELDVWSAAGLGRLTILQSLVAANPDLINARGPDGKTPLHCASSVTVAAFLISKGADLDAKCIDHESTPAQYLVAKHPEITRYLVQKGCSTDIMMAAALGDLPLSERILDQQPDAINCMIDREHFPTSAADCIYSWTLGWYLTPHQVAKKFEHKALVQYLLDHSPPPTKLLNACLLGTDEANLPVDQSSDLVDQLSDTQKKHIAHAARNNQTEVVARLLHHGFPVDAVGQHAASALHWAAFHGNVKMTQEILRYGPPLELQDSDFHGTPLAWAREGCLKGWHPKKGDYPGVIRLLLDAGCDTRPDWKPLGKPEIDRLF